MSTSWEVCYRILFIDFLHLYIQAVIHGVSTSWRVCYRIFVIRYFCKIIFCTGRSTSWGYFYTCNYMLNTAKNINFGFVVIK